MLTDADLANLVTKDQLDTAFSTNIGSFDDGTGIYKYVATKTELSTLEKNLIQRINDSLGATNADGTPKTIDQIIKEAVGVPADANGNPTGLYKDVAGIDITVDDIKTVVDGIATTLGTTASEVTAIKTALENNLGAPSVVDAEGNITTEATGIYGIIEGLATKTQVSDVEKSILAKIKEYTDAGFLRDEALQKAIDDVATDLGTTKEAITKQLTDFKSDLATEIATLATKVQVSAVEKSILAKMKEYTDAGMDRDEALQKALDEANTNIDQLAEDLGTTKEAITQQLTDFQTKLDADLALLATKKQVNDLETELYLKLAEYEAQGKTRDEATKLAIADLATDLETTEENLMTRLGVTQDTLTNRINEVETNLTNQFNSQIESTKELITETATETQKQIQTTANQTAARDMFDLLLEQEDLEGQKVTVSQSPLAQINYIYDWQDPLANQQQRGFFGAASPYGPQTKINAGPQARGLGSIMQGPLNMQGMYGAAKGGPVGMAAGGKVDYDFLEEISQIMRFGE
jgi:predicted ArsR family transcriptional regulator